MSKIIENYLLQEVVGQGQYGKVYKSINTKTNEVFAVKVIKMEKFKTVPKLQEFTINEIETLTKINNVNIIQFVEMLRTTNNIYLVYGFCNGGTLEDEIKKNRFLKEDRSLKLLQEIIHGFKTLFKLNILHRDLKPSNIMFHNNDLKIGDFGFCKTLTGPSDLAQTMVGSPIYMAPEILKGESYNIKADIWSIGVCFFEMLFGYCPYEDRTIARLIMQINHKPLIIPTDKQRISQTSIDLLKAMLITDPEKRIDWPTLLTHPLFKDYKPTIEIPLKQNNEKQNNQNSLNNQQMLQNQDQLQQQRQQQQIQNNANNKNQNEYANYSPVSKQNNFKQGGSINSPEKYGNIAKNHNKIEVGNLTPKSNNLIPLEGIDNQELNTNFNQNNNNNVNNNNQNQNYQQTYQRSKSPINSPFRKYSQNASQVNKNSNQINFAINKGQQFQYSQSSNNSPYMAPPNKFQNLLEENQKAKFNNGEKQFSSSKQNNFAKNDNINNNYQNQYKQDSNDFKQQPVQNQYQQSYLKSLTSNLDQKYPTQQQLNYQQNYQQDEDKNYNRSSSPQKNNHYSYKNISAQKRDSLNSNNKNNNCINLSSNNKNKSKDILQIIPPRRTEQGSYSSNNRDSSPIIQIQEQSAAIQRPRKDYSPLPNQQINSYSNNQQPNQAVISGNYNEKFQKSSNSGFSKINGEIISNNNNNNNNGQQSPLLQYKNQQNIQGNSPGKEVRKEQIITNQNSAVNKNQEVINKLKQLNEKRQKIIQNLHFIKWFFIEKFDSNNSNNQNSNQLQNEAQNENEIIQWSILSNSTAADEDNNDYNEVFIFLVIKYSTISIYNILKQCEQIISNDREQKEAKLYKLVLDKEYDLFFSLYKQYKQELRTYLEQNGGEIDKSKFQLDEIEKELNTDLKINQQLFISYVDRCVRKQLIKDQNLNYSQFNILLESLLYEQEEQFQIQKYYSNQILNQNTNNGMNQSQEQNLGHQQQKQILYFKLDLINNKRFDII